MGFHVSGEGRVLGAAARGDSDVDAVNARRGSRLRRGRQPISSAEAGYRVWRPGVGRWISALDMKRNCIGGSISGLSLAALVCLACLGCRQRDTDNLTVWHVLRTNGVSFQIPYIAYTNGRAYMTVPEGELHRIIQRASQDIDGLSLTLCVARGASVSNCFGILTHAETCGITNIAIRLHQKQPAWGLKALHQ